MRKNDINGFEEQFSVIKQEIKKDINLRINAIEAIADRNFV